MREALREKGQFWTPDWVAEAMVSYVLASGAQSIFDPAVGAGAFFRAAKSVGRELRRVPQLLGTEIDPSVLGQAKENGLTESDLALVELRDFVLDPPLGYFEAIVANPPYIRHHRLSSELKAKLRALAVKLIGRPLDGRAGLHVYFLLRALQLLAPGGRLAFIMPADTCEGVFAPVLWEWITRHYRLEAVITFDPDASPFPDVDTNPLIFMIRRARPTKEFLWARCLQSEGEDLRRWVLSGFTEKPTNVIVYRRTLAEGLRTGLSRPPCEAMLVSPCLGDFATVLRGIATGANDFFFLTRERAKALGIPRRFLVPAVGRTRDVPGDRIDDELLEALDKRGRPTLLFCPDGRPLDDFPEAHICIGCVEGEQHSCGIIRLTSSCEVRICKPYALRASLSPVFWTKKSAIGNSAGCVGRMERFVAPTAAATR